MADLGILGQTLDGGTLNTLAPNASQEDVVASLNDIIRRLNTMLKLQVFSDGESKRYIQGYFAGRWPGGDFGIAISKEGDDVYTTDFDNLLFAWDFSTNNQYFNGGQQQFVGGTSIYVDPSTLKDFFWAGILPDSTGGFIAAKEGLSVKDDVYGP